MASEQRARLGALVEQLTTTGQRQLDPSQLKELKKIVRTSDDYISHVLYLLRTQLDKDHAEVRLSAVQIIDQLFRRSHFFRTILLDQFQAFLEQTVETNPDNPLPPPKSAAKELKMLTLRLIKEWHTEFHTGYKSLTLAIHYLEHCKPVDWNAAQRPAEPPILNEAELANRRYRENILAERARTMCIEIDNQKTVLEGNIIELENCLQLLVPSVDDPFEVFGTTEPDRNEPGPSRQLNREERLRVRGMPANFELTVEIPRTMRIVEGPDNADIIANLKEFSQLLRDKHLPLVQKWLKMLSKLHGASTSHIKYLIDLKEKMEKLDGKLRELNIETPVLTAGQGGDSSDEDDDFEEVEQKDIEEIIPPHWREEYGLEPLPQKPLLKAKRNVIDETIDPTSRAAQYKRIVERHSVQAKRKKADAHISLVRRSQAKSELPTTNAPQSSSSNGRSTGHSSKKSPPASTDRPAISAENSQCNVKNSKQQNVCNSDEDLLTSTDGGSKSPQYEAGPSGTSTGDSCRKDQLLKKAPRVNFDIDLIHWEDEKLETAIQVIPFESHNGFHKPRDDDQINDIQRKAAEARLRERKIDFSGTFERVQWACRAPLPSGKLCPRQDRYKCPFHGKIIARDEMGRPSSGTDEGGEPSTSSASFSQQLDWQDPELLRDIQAETGIDLRMPPKKGQRGKKKKECGLSDIKKEQDTTRRRLEKKVFNKTSAMRVAATLDALDRRKYDDKFGDQWNYT